MCVFCLTVVYHDSSNRHTFGGQGGGVLLKEGERQEEAVPGVEGGGRAQAGRRFSNDYQLISIFYFGKCLKTRKHARTFFFFFFLSKCFEQIFSTVPTYKFFQKLFSVLIFDSEKIF